MWWDKHGSIAFQVEWKGNTENILHMPAGISQQTPVLFEENSTPWYSHWYDQSIPGVISWWSVVIYFLVHRYFPLPALSASSEVKRFPTFQQQPHTPHLNSVRLIKDLTWILIYIHSTVLFRFVKLLLLFSVFLFKALHMCTYSLSAPPPLNWAKIP